MHVLKHIVITLLCITLYAVCVPTVNAAVYDLDYTVTYTLNASEYTDVSLDVVITHNRADLYVDKFNLTLPAVFDIDSIRVTSDQGEVNFDKELQDQKVKLSFAWVNPEVGNSSQNNLHIIYRQKNLTRLSGNVLEAILPTMADTSAKSVTVVVNKSPDITLPLTIAKPRPTSNDGITMKWTDMKAPALYVLFGEYQLYDLQLSYTIKNTKVTPGYMDIALPPETLFQSILVSKLDPLPESVISDDDGNYIARYSLAPFQEKRINFAGQAKVYPRAQEDMLPYIRNAFEKQKGYLLGTSHFWDISKEIEQNTIPQLRSPLDIYKYVLDTLTYSTARISSKMKRLGAGEALRNPTNAVCTEFTDSFIALAREKGIYAREHEGFAYAQNSTIQPVSLVTDVLHAWPEFYDLPSQRWMPVDPTWEDTSGIDYFSAMDVNHITFAIHGKDSTYPMPAGMYKTRDSKDVLVSVTKDASEKKSSLEVLPVFESMSRNGDTYEGRLEVKNTGNVYLKNKTISLIGNNIKISKPIQTIDLLAPYEKRIITFSYERTSDASGSVHILIPDLYEGTIPLDVPHKNKYSNYFFALIIIVGILLFFFLHKGRKRHRAKHAHERI